LHSSLRQASTIASPPSSVFLIVMLPKKLSLN
jgi:hypothetical protein